MRFTFADAADGRAAFSSAIPDAERTLEAYLDDELGRDSEPSNEEGMVESVN